MEAEIWGGFWVAMFWSVVALVGLYLAFVPLMILRELRRQGKAREGEALKIISLLGHMSGGQSAPSETARLQALADIRATSEKP